VLLTSKQGPFADCRSVTWQEVAKTPLCLLTQDMMNRQTIDAVFHETGSDISPTLETNSILSILAHVGTAQWSSIVPRSLLEQIGTPKGVIAVDLVEPQVDWATGLVTLAREPAPPMVQEIESLAQLMVASFGPAE
jgi:DNA-binding transcriptional LysR family regulator